MDNRLQILAIVLLTLATAGIHLGLAAAGGFDVLQDPLALPFILNGIGFIGLLLLYLLTMVSFIHLHNAARWLLIIFSAVTIIAFFTINPEPLASVFGLITKAIEVALIIVLWQSPSSV